MKVLLVVLAVLACVSARRYNLGNLLDNYDKNEPPAGVTDIRVGFYVNQLQITKEKTIKMTFYIRQAWQDERLAGLDDEVSLVENNYKDIWLPDLFFRNALRAGRRENGMTVEQLTFINTTGHVWHVMTIDGEFGCYDLLADTPEKVCPMMVESYSYTTDFLTLSFYPEEYPVYVENFNVPGYFVTDFETQDCSETYSVGTFPCLSVEVHLSEDHRCAK